MDTSTRAETPAVLRIPRGFWRQIKHQLTRICDPSVDSFDAVRDILHDDRYDEIVAEVTRNGPALKDDDTAFFAGSGGDDTVRDALSAAGWRIAVYRSRHYYVARSPIGDLLTYCEGDVLRGDRISA